MNNVWIKLKTWNYFDMCWNQQRYYNSQYDKKKKLINTINFMLMFSIVFVNYNANKNYLFVIVSWKLLSFYLIKTKEL